LDWQIKVSKTAVKQLKKLDKTVQKRIIRFFKEKPEINAPSPVWR